jgi:hypothetical protein
LFTEAGTTPSLSPKKKTWKKAGRYWIGYETLPTVKDLAKKQQLKGDTIVAAGQELTVPKAVTFDEADGDVFTRWHLSRYVSFDDDGEPTYGDVEERYAPLFDVAMKWIGTASGEAVSLGQVWKWAGQIMSFNYRMGFHEMCLMNLLTDETAVEILEACVDSKGLVELAEQTEKKDLADDGSNTNGGEVVGSDTTSPPSPTS